MNKSNIQKKTDAFKKDSSNKSSFKKADLENKLEVMAYEETFNSWMRVGLYALTGGLFVAKVIYSKEESIITNYFGIGAILASIIVICISYFIFKKNMDNVKHKHAKRSISKPLTLINSMFLTFGAILSLIFILKN